MQSKTIFKINSQTHKDALQKMDVVSRVQHECQITYEQWAEILFEAGCRFVELKITQPSLQNELLKKPELKFWDWWYMQWIIDDEWILDLKIRMNEEKYRRQKQCFAALFVMEESFNDFLNRRTL